MKGFIFILFLLPFIKEIPFINEAQLNKQLKKNSITVIEFYASWNDINSVKDISNLKSCDVFRVDIDKEPLLQSQYNVIVIPTIIIFNKGEELKRYQANLLFKMCPKSFSCTKVQEKIDNLTMNKFR